MEVAWWYWLALGLILIVLEVAISGEFYILFFGIAALTIGTLRLFDVADAVWIQLLLFSTVSVLSLLAFRGPLMRWLQLDRGAMDVDTLVGETALPLEDLPAGSVGRAELRGTVWTARNAGSSTLARGQRCRVTSVDHLTLLIDSEGAR
jgi:inner membrane protein